MTHRRNETNCYKCYFISFFSYCEVPCPDGSGKEIYYYCANDGWDVTRTRNTCDSIVSEMELEEANAITNTYLFIAAFLMALLIAACIFGYCFYSAFCGEEEVFEQPLLFSLNYAIFVCVIPVEKFSKKEIQ